MSAPTDLLRRVSLFEEMSDKQLKRVAESFKEIRFASGETVAEEGTRAGARFLVVAEGTATVSVGGRVVGSLGPGDGFGEIALIDEGDRSATVVADADLLCYGITPWVFKPLVEDNPEIAWKLLQALAKRLRAAEARG